MEAFDWICPFCGTATTIGDYNYRTTSADVAGRSKFGSAVLVVRSISCPNSNCKELQIEASLHRHGLPAGQSSGSHSIREKYESWKLRPKTRTKPQPEYVPLEIRNNYAEACLILNDSPKASAAMSRRCLQGIVRDFWNIPQNKRGNLGAELTYIKDQVDSDTWDAIQAVRSVGDIGAHMEKDVDLIIDVEPKEAELLVELIETLLDDWYVEREKRRLRNSAMKALAAAKLEAKRQGKQKKNDGSPNNETSSSNA
jgi:hypothetical protein